MISPKLAACLAGAALALWTGTAGHAETNGMLRPLARPATLAVSAAAPPDPSAPSDPSTQAEGATTPDVLANDNPADEIQASATAPIAEIALGPSTNLPVPRYVSLKTNEGNVRRGPSLSHRIDWVFTREDMPLLITAEYGHWRRVVDRDGLGGWVHYSLVSGARTVIVDQDMLALRATPDDEAIENALLEQGVIARLGECSTDWCRISAGGYRGWVHKAAIWGVDADEIRD